VTRADQRRTLRRGISAPVQFRQRIDDRQLAGISSKSPNRLRVFGPHRTAANKRCQRRKQAVSNDLTLVSTITSRWEAIGRLRNTYFAALFVARYAVEPAIVLLSDGANGHSVSSKCTAHELGIC